MGYIGIWKQKGMFRTYYRKGDTGPWERIRLEAEEETPWSTHSFNDIFRYKQIDEMASSLGILVISDQEESIDFPAVSEAIPFSYQKIRDFCQKYASKGAAHWQINGQAMDEELCQKAGFPMDSVGDHQYILTNAAPTGSLETLLVPEPDIFKEEDTVHEEVTESKEATEPAPIPTVSWRHEAYFQEIYNGDRENPLKKW